MGVLYQAGLGSIEEKRRRTHLELRVQVPANRSPTLLRRRIRQLEKATPGGRVFRGLRVKKVPRGPWEKKYQSYLRPFVLLRGLSGKREELVVDPRGVRSAKTPDALLIRASLAFGTGTHATTQLSAEFLAQALAEKSQASVLDMGCGTGILAMVARRAGAKRVVAVDSDPIALEIAAENLQLNRMRGIRLKNSLRGRSQKFDIIVANIGLNTLLELRPLLLRHLAVKGDLILSGLLYRDFGEIRRAYRELKWGRRKNKKGWTALLLRR